MDDGGLSKARDAHAAQAHAAAQRAAEEDAERRAIVLRAKRTQEAQNARVERAIAAFLSETRTQRICPQQFYLGRATEPVPTGFEIFRWQRPLGDGQSERLSVVVWPGGRVSFGDHHGQQPTYGPEDVRLPFHLNNTDRWAPPLRSGWLPAAEPEAGIVATADWFVARLGQYLVDKPGMS
jgi:hypothetical protein